VGQSVADSDENFVLRALKVVGSRDDLAGHVVQRRPGDPPVAAHGC
jgi:hypothetical protein